MTFKTRNHSFTCRAVLKCVPSAIARWLKLFEKVLWRKVHTSTIKDITNPFWKNSHTVGLNGWKDIKNQIQPTEKSQNNFLELYQRIYFYQI